jgi:hypothetical protein
MCTDKMKLKKGVICIVSLSMISSSTVNNILEQKTLCTVSETVMNHAACKCGAIPVHLWQMLVNNSNRHPFHSY